MLSSISNKDREMPKRPFYLATLIVEGLFLQVLAFTKFAVFAPYYQFCSTPAFVGDPSPASDPCAVILKTSPQTAIQLLSTDHALLIAFPFLIYAICIVIAFLVRSRILSLVSFILSLLWLIVVILLLSRNLPAPVMQNPLWYSFLTLIVISFILLICGNVRLLILQKPKLRNEDSASETYSH